MAVIVDTSVWSLLFRKAPAIDHPKVQILTSLLERSEDLAITGVILQEILQAFRRDSDFRRVSQYFRPFETIKLERSDYVSAAKLHRTCASRGVAASTVDCQIAAASIRKRYVLLTADRDFERIAEHSSLKLI